jgi:hypothetical protein
MGLEALKSEVSGRMVADRSIPTDSRLYTVSRIVKMDEDARRVTHVISTARLDRGGRYIEQSGWQLGEYRKNNVVMANHDYDIEKMIGNGVDVAVVDDELQATTEFGAEALGPLAFRLVQSGMAKAWSVGWQGTKSHSIGAEEGCAVCAMLQKKIDWGVHYVKQTLLEYSLVAVPANPDAVMRLQAAGFPISKAEREMWVSLGEKAEGVANCEVASTDEVAHAADQAPPIFRSAAIYESVFSVSRVFARRNSALRASQQIRGSNE